jgi:HD-like signal output (HDOD) protein
MSDDGSEEQGSLRSLNLRLPPLPQTLPQVLELLHEPGFVTTEDLAEVVQGDPAAVARLLKHINSAYYGLRRSITDVERAIRMMGPTTASGTVISLCMLEMSELMEGPAESCFRSILRHSEATAFLTRHLLDGEVPEAGEEAPEEDVRPAGGDGFTEGLLHDFGKLVLIYNYPEKAVSIYEDRVFEEYLAGTNPRVLEQLVFGCDHTEAGGYAASEMNFPRALIDVIRYHHGPDEANLKADSLETVRAVSAANRATKAMGSAFVGLHPTEAELDWETCAEDPIWAHYLDGGEEDDDPQPMALMDELNAKRDDIMLFTKFFLDPDIPDPVQSSS